MTPKEKARDLFNAYFEYVEAFTIEQQNENAKQCSLILVNEIINSRKVHLVQSLKFYEYWTEVKQEIIKL